MKLILLILAAFIAVQCMVIPTGTCPGSRDDLLPCFQNMIDLNSDGNITLTELNTTITQNKACFPTQQPEYFAMYTPTMIMQQCDANGDGVLNMADWSHENACLKSDRKIDYMCRLCYVCQNHNSTK